MADRIIHYTHTPPKPTNRPHPNHSRHTAPHRTASHHVWSVVDRRALGMFLPVLSEEARRMDPSLDALLPPLAALRSFSIVDLTPPVLCADKKNQTRPYMHTCTAARAWEGKRRELTLVELTMGHVDHTQQTLECSELTAYLYVRTPGGTLQCTSAPTYTHACISRTNHVGFFDRPACRTNKDYKSTTCTLFVYTTLLALGNKYCRGASSTLVSV